MNILATYTNETRTSVAVSDCLSQEMGFNFIKIVIFDVIFSGISNKCI